VVYISEAGDVKKDDLKKDLATVDEKIVVKREAFSEPGKKDQTEKRRRRKKKTKKSRKKVNRRRKDKQRKRSKTRKSKSNSRSKKPDKPKNKKKKGKKNKVSNKRKKSRKRKENRRRKNQGRTKKRTGKDKRRNSGKGQGRKRSKKTNKKRRKQNQKEQSNKKEKVEKKTEKLSKRQKKLNRKKSISSRQTNFTTCAETLFSLSKMALGIAVNVEKQVNTANTRSKTVTNKNGKKGDFDAPLGTLLTALGGNASAPECAGKPLRNAKYKDTLSTLKGCESKIKSSCNYTISAAMKTTIDDCKKKATKLRSDVLTCSKKASAVEGCSCLDDIKVTSKELQDCRDTTLKVRNEAVKNKNDCVIAFRACKSAEDAAVDGVGTCKQVNKCGGAMNKTEAMRQLRILKPLQEALKNTGFEDALKKLGLDTGTGSDGKGYDGSSRMSRLTQLRLARYDATNEDRQANNTDSAGCLEIVDEWKNFNTSGDKAVPGVGDDVDSKETTNTINSLDKLNKRSNLETDLGSCAKESRQAVTVTLSIVKIRFYVFWCGWFRVFIVEIKIITLEISFGASSPSPAPSPVSTAAPGGRHLANQIIKRAALKQKKQQLN